MDAMWMTLTACALGLAAGVRHAFEPDHLAAVSTLVTGARPGRATLRFAAAWGAGHGAVLLAVGGLLFALRAEMPARVADGLELLVAFMLVVLGVRGIRRARAEPRHAVHEHAHEHAAPATSLTALPFLVGTLHGLAGSGGLTAVVAAEQPSLAGGLLTMGLYGLGAAVGMVALAGVATLPLRRQKASGARILATGGVVASGVSVAVGLAWGAPVVHRMLGWA
jgi:high-affinity nickel-transport protein